MKLAITGHRPDKLGGYGPSPKQASIRMLMETTFMEMNPEAVICGMALGADQWAAEVCNDLHIPWIAAIPFKGQESKWPAESQARYHALLTAARDIHFVCEPGYAIWKLHKRNEWMVDNADVVLAIWDGSEGGTAGCVKYATKQNKPTVRIDPTSL